MRVSMILKCFKSAEEGLPESALKLDVEARSG